MRVKKSIFTGWVYLLANLRVEVIGYGSFLEDSLAGRGNALSCRMSILYVTVLDPSVGIKLGNGIY